MQGRQVLFRAVNSLLQPSMFRWCSPTSLVNKQSALQANCMMKHASVCNFVYVQDWDKHAEASCFQLALELKHTKKRKKLAPMPGCLRSDSSPPNSCACWHAHSCSNGTLQLRCCQCKDCCQVDNMWSDRVLWLQWCACPSAQAIELNICTHDSKMQVIPYNTIFLGLESGGQDWHHKCL